MPPVNLPLAKQLVRAGVTPITALRRSRHPDNAPMVDAASDAGELL